MSHATSEQKQKKSRSSLQDEAAAALKRLEAKDPGIKAFLKKKAYAYAVFPSVGKAAVVVGGGYGRGMVFERGRPVGYATISKLTLGVDLGGNTFTELVAFESKEVFERFKKGKMSFAADASVVIVKAGASATANFEKGAVTFAYSQGGLKLESAIGGQKFKFKPMSDEDEQGQGNEDDDDDAGDEEGGGAEANGEDDQDEQRDEGEEDEGEEGEESDDDGPSLAERAGAGLKAARHLQKAASGGKIAKAFGLWGAARQLQTAGAGATSGARNLITRRPVMAALVGGGLAAGAILVAASLMGAFATGGQESDDQDEGADDSESDNRKGEAVDQSEDQDAEEDEGEGEGQAEDDYEGGEEESGGNEDEEDDPMPRRMAARGRSRP
jgi:lipid-binding SYLF domain-containing protein